MPQPLSFSRFLKKLMVYSGILAILSIGAFISFPANYFSPAYPYLFLFFIVTTLTGYWLIIRSAYEKPVRFINTYLLVTVVKLLVFTGILVVYILLNKKDALPFGLSFLILYLLFTVFEVISLVSYSRNSGK